MAMTYEEIDSLVSQALRLADSAGDFAGARDALLVAADAAEEIGENSTAGFARRRATELHVLLWALQRWPGEIIGVNDVHLDLWRVTQPKRRSRVDFAIRRSPRSWVYVSVGRRGDVREEEP